MLNLLNQGAPCPPLAAVGPPTTVQLTHFHCILCVPGRGEMVQFIVIFAALLLPCRFFLLFATRMCWTSVFRGHSIGFGSTQHVFMFIFVGARVLYRIFRVAFGRRIIINFVPWSVVM
jgi:hypothetical protein